VAKLPGENTMSENTVAVTDASFDIDVINSDVPVLLDFWAPWCGPCKMIAPVLEEVAVEFDGSVKVCKINVDENTEIAGRFGVRGIPTLMLFKDGEVAGTKVGAMSKSDLLAFISDNT
jgi:thioredoxin 1